MTHLKLERRSHEEHTEHTELLSSQGLRPKKKHLKHKMIGDQGDRHQGTLVFSGLATKKSLSFFSNSETQSGNLINGSIWRSECFVGFWSVHKIFCHSTGRLFGMQSGPWE